MFSVFSPAASVVDFITSFAVEFMTLAPTSLNPLTNVHIDQFHHLGSLDGELCCLFL